MSNVNTTLTYFDVIDYKGDYVLSAYCLSSTPLSFIPDINALENTDILWNFGDGTTSDSLCATKYYNKPGVYTVNLIAYDCNNNATVSMYSQNVTIVDFVEHTLYFDNLSTSDGFIELNENKIHGPWNLITTYPWHVEQADVLYTVDGSGSSYYFDVKDNKFSHLQRTYSFFEAISNISLSALQYKEIPKIEIKNKVDLYAKIENGSVNYCNSTDLSAFFVGTSALNPVYYKDDIRGNTSIKLKFDDYSENFNNLGIYLSAVIIENISYGGSPDDCYLSITSNGIDGEKTPITSFDLNHTKFFNKEIPFVIKLKDLENHSIKSITEIELSDILSQPTYFQVLSGEYLTDENGEYIYTNVGKIITSYGIVPTSYYTLSSLNDTLSSIDHNGSFRGYIKFNQLDSPLHAVQLSSRLVIGGDGSSYEPSGESAYFDIYPSKYYEIFKQNENFDASDTMRNLAFQESINKNDKLFEDFLGSIFGDDNLDHESIGVKTYEAIANFVANNKDLDTESITALVSDLRMMDSDELIFDKNITNYPEKIKRLLNLISVKESRLKGTKNKFSLNFDPKGHTQKDYFGINLGDQITDPVNYTLSAGTDIVALEKFSNTYVKLNSWQPFKSSDLESETSSKLINYTSDWGWPLVLPDDFDPSDFEKYYEFFEYNDQYDNTVVDAVIDYDNSKTNIEYNLSKNFDLFRDDGVFNTMLLDSLYESLSI